MITMQINYKTQAGKILTRLRELGEQGVEAYELTTRKPEGLGIQQYNARVFELRQKGYIIVNNPIGHFTLEETEETRPKHYEFDPVTCTAKLI
jgi:hypothetical protein